MKLCKGCSTEKASCEFYSHKNATDGLSPKCKECVKARAAKYRRDNPKPRVKRGPRKDGFRLLPDGMRKCSKCQDVKPMSNFHKNTQRASGVTSCCKKCVNSEAKERRNNHYEELLQRRREWRDKNRQRVREVDAKWREENRDKKRLTESRRRARKQALPDTLTSEETESILAKFNDRCALCDSPAEALDHFIPLASGHGGTTKENIIPLCRNMNSSKNDRNPFEWARLCLSNSEKKRFDLLIEYLADINELEVDKYR